VRRNPAPLSRRPAVPRHDDALHAGIRTPAGEDQSERPRWLAVARLSSVEHRQGLHNPRARLGPARVKRDTKNPALSKNLEHDAISRTRIMLQSAVARSSAVGGE